MTVTDHKRNKTEVEIDVIGGNDTEHAREVDNNGSDATTVDPSRKRPVKVDEGEQDTQVTVKFPEGKKPTVNAVDEDGNSVKVEIMDGKLIVNPDSDKDGKAINVDGPMTVTITDDKGNKTTVEIDVTREDGEKHAKGVDDNGNGVPAGTAKAGLTEGERDHCIAAGVGFGPPLLALIPLGIALTVGIPGLEDQVARFNASIERANTNLQKQLGIYNPEMAVRAAEVNAQLKEYDMNLVTGAGALLLIPLIVGNALGIAGACTPGNMSSLGSTRS